MGKITYTDLGADISSCGQFRYRLWRRWGDGNVLPWIMLNPSTADGREDDQTIRKCVGFAHRFCYTGIEVFNLWAFRATNPRVLRQRHFPIGDKTDEVMLNRLGELGVTAGAGIVLCAWGAYARRQVWRPREVLRNLDRIGARAKALRLLPDGTPEHPLMLPYRCSPVEMPA